MAACLINLAGCSGQESGKTQEESAEQIILKSEDSYPGIILRREVVYTDSLLLDKIHDITIDDNGSVYLAGEKWNHLEIHKFSATGGYLGSFGSLGDEYGSFQSIDRMSSSGSDIWISDAISNRNTRFDTSTGDLLETIELDSLFVKIEESEIEIFNTIDPVGVVASERLLVTLSKERNPAYQPEFRQQYAFLNVPKSDPDSVSLDSLFKGSAQRYVVGDYAGRPVAFLLDINERPLVDFKLGGPIYVANSSKFTVRVFSQDGKMIRLYRFPYKRLRLDPEEEVFPAYTYNRQLLMVRESAEYPDYWPALYDMFLDDEERLWVSTVTRDRSLSEWFVVDDQKKRIVASFMWPSEKQIWDVKNGRAYSVESDSAGFKTVVSYGFEFETQ